MSQMETTSDYGTELEESDPAIPPQPMIPVPADDILDHDLTQPIVTRSLSDPLSLPSDEGASTVTTPQVYSDADRFFSELTINESDFQSSVQSGVKTIDRMSEHKHPVEERKSHIEKSSFAFVHNNTPIIKELHQQEVTHRSSQQQDGLYLSATDRCSSDLPRDRSNHQDSGFIKQCTERKPSLFSGEYIKMFEVVQDEYCIGPTKRGMKRLREQVETMQDGAVITFSDGSEVTQKEFLSDIIDNQLLLISGKPPYCVLCGRKKLTDIKHPCAYCKCTSRVTSKCCSNCNQLKEYTTGPCEMCGCMSTSSFECCTNCGRTKVTAVASHAIPNCTLKGMENESGGPVICSYKHGIVKPAKDVTWYILCSHCERANNLNKAESETESIRRKLNSYETDDCDVGIETCHIKLLLLAAAFNIYRGFMVTVDLLEELDSPGLAYPLLQTFYSLKQYCKKPSSHPPPDIYFFLLPTFNVYGDFSQNVKRHLLHDFYMRMIKFTHVATTVPYSPEHSFLYTSFDRFHFVLPLPRCKEELIPDMLSRYPPSVEFYPNLSQHQSTEFRLRNGPIKLCEGQIAETFFPQLLYIIGYWGAKKLKKMCVNVDIKIVEYLTFKPKSFRGFVNVGSKAPQPESKQIRKTEKMVKFVRYMRSTNPVQEVQPVQAVGSFGQEIKPVQEVGSSGQEIKPVQEESQD